MWSGSGVMWSGVMWSGSGVEAGAQLFSEQKLFVIPGVFDVRRNL